MTYEEAMAHVKALEEAGACSKWLPHEDAYRISGQALHALKKQGEPKFAYQKVTLDSSRLPRIDTPGPVMAFDPGLRTAPQWIEPPPVPEGLKEIKEAAEARICGIPVRIDPLMPPGEIRLEPGGPSPKFARTSSLAHPDVIANTHAALREYRRRGTSPYPYPYPPAEINGLRNIVNNSEEETMHDRDYECANNPTGMKASFVTYDEADAPQQPESYSKTLKRLRKEIRDVEKARAAFKKARKEQKRAQKEAAALAAKAEADRALAIDALRHVASERDVRLVPSADRVAAAQRLLEWL